MADSKKHAPAIAAALSVVSVVVVVKHVRCKHFIPREPYVNKWQERDLYMSTIFCKSDVHCNDQIRMRPAAFMGLCKILRENNLLHETIHMSIKEQVLLFLHIIGHNVRFRVMVGRLYRSTATVHRYFKRVLKAILQLYRAFVKEPDDSTPSKISTNSIFYPFFKDCVGALDGTHIHAFVPVEIQGRFRGRKGMTQNVLAAINFDLRFTYILASWEGSAHDSKVLNDALTRPMGLVIPEGKYYLGDAGYGNRVGVLAPYRGVRYHLKEFSNSRPENKEELFNLRHSSLRTTIERGFGVLKKRFRVLDSEPFWSFCMQVDVVLACCVIHNYLRGVDPNDFIMDEFNREAHSESETQRNRQTQSQSQAENREWTIKRDEIAHAMWINYRSRI